MSEPDSQENPWRLASTCLAQAHAVKDLLAAYGVDDPKHVAIVIAVLNEHGLFHTVSHPKPGESSKEIGRRAKRTAKALGRRIANIRNGKGLPIDSREAELANRWEQLGEDRMRLEELKVMSETFQIRRGSTIIPRYASRDRRQDLTQGPRSEPDITHAVQILDRYLREECTMRTNWRMECLGYVLRAAMNLSHSPKNVSEQVRWRLRTAKTKIPLDNVDYYEATGVSYKLNDDRQKTFWKCQAILNSLETSAKEKQQARRTLQKLFSLK